MLWPKRGENWTFAPLRDEGLSAKLCYGLVFGPLRGEACSTKLSVQTWLFSRLRAEARWELGIRSLAGGSDFRQTVFRTGSSVLHRAKRVQPKCVQIWLFGLLRSEACPAQLCSELGMWSLVG
jgi:hypothetical protein